MIMRLVRDNETMPEDTAELEPTRPTDAARGADDPAPDEQPDGAVPTDTDAPAEGGADATETPAEPALDVALLEAFLFSTRSPLTAQRLAELMDLKSLKPLRAAIKHLNQTYADTSRCFRIEQVAGGYQLLTLPDYGDAIKRLHQKEADTKLTKAALETLAIIAYKQPILRADLEAIRGVACGETIRSLMEKHLVKIAGRAELPGRPILYGTTKRFLELFGLNTLKDLPQDPDNRPAAAAPKRAPIATTENEEDLDKSAGAPEEPASEKPTADPASTEPAT
jgi:segregation and condensation protein B